MNHKEFIKALEEKYNLLIDFEDDCIDTYYFGDYPDLYIDIDKEKNIFSIYAEFTHPLFETEEFEHEGEIIMYYAKYFESILREKFLITPEESFGNYLGAPFDDQRIGYFHIPFEFDFIVTFLEAYDIWLDTMNGVDNDELDGEEIWKNLLLSKWKTYKSKIISRGYIDKENYIKRHNTDLVITSLYFEKEFCKEFNIDVKSLYLIEKEHHGGSYILFKIEDEKIIAVRRELYDEVLNTIETVEDTFDIKLFTDSKSILYIKFESIIAVIPICDNLDYIRTLEYNYLSEILQTFNEFTPPQMINDISFENLDDKLFEKLCFEFLDCEGYFDIHPVGKTRASDRGCDLFAKKCDNEFLTKRSIEKWIIQCKYSKSGPKKSFRREMFSEIQDLLEENNSNKYMLLTTADLTPSVVYRINSINNRKHNIIEFLAVNELKLALCKYPKLIYKYGLIKEKNNNI